jgi:hypothetical protein
MSRLAFVGVLLSAAYLTTGCQETKGQKEPPPFMAMPNDMGVNIYPGPVTGNSVTPAASAPAAPARGQ